MTRPTLQAVLAVLLTVTCAKPATGQSTPDTGSERLTVDAVRVPDATIRLDGQLTEDVWASTPVAGSFRQVEPDAGAPAELGTEARIAFDNQALYVSAVMRDSLGAEGLRIRDLRRDFDYFDNDHFSVVLDPFGDLRNAIAFQITPYGALRDLQVRDGVDYNRDWDGVWDA
ncbi:MAG: carbohydrate binding family 9 domain-containing protein, partial [Bacteroidota bacterium]